MLGDKVIIHQGTVPPPRSGKGFTSVAKYGPKAWQSFMNRGKSLDTISFEKYARLHRMKPRMSGVFFRVVVDGQLYGSTKIWVPKDETIHTTMKRTFGDSVKWNVVNDAVAYVWTSDFDKSSPMLPIDVGCCVDYGHVGESFCDRIMTGIDSVCSRFVSTPIVDRSLVKEATVDNGIGVPDMRRYVGNDFCGQQHAGEFSDDVGTCRERVRRIIHRSRCTGELHVVPIGTRKKCLKAAKSSCCNLPPVPPLVKLSTHYREDVCAPRDEEDNGEFSTLKNHLERMTNGEAKKNNTTTMSTPPDLVRLDGIVNNTNKKNNNNYADLPDLVNIDGLSSTNHVAACASSSSPQRCMVFADPCRRPPPGLVSITHTKHKNKFGKRVVKRCTKTGIMPWREKPTLIMLPSEELAAAPLRFKKDGPTYTMHSLIDAYTDIDFRQYAMRQMAHIPTKKIRCVEDVKHCMASAVMDISVLGADKTPLRYELTTAGNDVIIAGSGKSRAKLSSLWKPYPDEDLYVLELDEQIHT